MKVTLKLFASLAKFLPDDASRNEVSLEVADDTTIVALLDHYNLPPQSCHLVLVNGVFQPPRLRASVALNDGDELAVWPPVAGG